MNPWQRPFPLVSQLLRHAAGTVRELRFDLLADAEREFRWVCQGGLGPLLWHVSQSTGSWVPSHWHPLLHAADLTAQMYYKDLADTAMQVIHAANAVAAPVTLLKGISVAEEIYPKPHLRPMGDVDVLVPGNGYAGVEAALLQGDYQRLDFPDVEGLQHGAPLENTELRTLVELHTELFGSNSPLRRPGKILNAATVEVQHIVPSLFRGQPVKRLSAEFPLLYIAASWFNDLTHFPPHPSFLASLFDAVYLTRRYPELLDDDRISTDVDNPFARASLYALLTYLPRFGVRSVSPRRLAAMRRGLSVVGPLELRMIHGMLDHCMVGARAWNSMLPVPVPGRYSVRHQLAKKSTSLFHRA
ncbi:MAG: nucleotidyltransferase family protein [Pseudomonadota bacterium]